MDYTQFGPGHEWNAYQMLVPGDGCFDLRTIYADLVNKDVVLSDEIFWNPHSATGASLEAMNVAAHRAGFDTGVVITPALFINIDWVNGTSTLKSDEEMAAIEAKLADAVKNLDFVMVDPYVGLIPGADAWTQQFAKVADDWIHKQGKEAVLVVQGFAREGDEAYTLAAIQEQIVGQSYDRAVIFDLDDAADLVEMGGFVSINEDVVKLVGQIDGGI